jgi:hypothetical protein
MQRGLADCVMPPYLLQLLRVKEGAEAEPRSLENQEMILARAFDGGQRNRSIEGGEASAALNGEREQVDVA